MSDYKDDLITMKEAVTGMRMLSILVRTMF